MGIATNGASIILGSQSGFQALVKQHVRLATGVHCFIHREALVSKTLLAHLNTILKGLVKTVNYIKSSAMNSRLFQKLCQDLGSDYEVLLFYAPMRWLSDGNELNRIFALKDELI